MGNTVRREKCRQLVDAAARLPSFPAVVGKILAKMDDPRSDAQDVARLVESDVGLAAQVLRLANSAYYGVPGAVETVSNAIVVLGFKATRTLVLSAALAQLQPPRSPDSPHPRLFWEHSLETALFSRMLAMRTTVVPDAEALFTAGLLHDAGVLLLESSLGERYQVVLRRARRDCIPLDVAEQDILDIDHAEITGLLLERWELPTSLSVACTYHHRPWDAPNGVPSAFVVHMADQLSKRLHPTGHGYQPTQDALSWPHAKNVLGIAELDDEAILTLARSECEKASNLFQLFA